jgi:hypothetical protein
MIYFVISITIGYDRVDDPVTLISLSKNIDWMEFCIQSPYNKNRESLCLLGYKPGGL